MGLWIRSQDRETLIRIENVSITNDSMILGNLVSDDNKSVCDYWILGQYKTKKRALEVLDEIHQRLIDLQTLNHLQDDSDISWAHGRNIDCVYEMPQE